MRLIVKKMDLGSKLNPKLDQVVSIYQDHITANTVNQCEILPPSPSNRTSGAWSIITWVVQNLDNPTSPIGLALILC